MDSTSLRRPPATRVPQASHHSATLPRNVASNLDSFHSNAASSAPQPTTPEAIKLYRQRQSSRGAGQPTPPIGAALNYTERLGRPDRPFVRSFSSPQSSASQPASTPPLGDKGSIKDLVARFNNVGVTDTSPQPTRPLLSPAGSQTSRSRFQGVNARVPSNASPILDPEQGSRALYSSNSMAHPNSLMPGLRFVSTATDNDTSISGSKQGLGLSSEPESFHRVAAESRMSPTINSDAGIDIPTPTLRNLADSSAEEGNQNLQAHKGSHGSIEMSPLLPDAWHFNPEYFRTSPSALAHKRSHSDTHGLQTTQTSQTAPRKHMYRQSEDFSGVQRSRFSKNPSPHSRLPVRSPRIRSTGPGYPPTAQPFSSSPITPPKGRSPRKQEVSPATARFLGQRPKATFTTPILVKSPPLRSSRPRQYVSTATRNSAPQDPFVVSTLLATDPKLGRQSDLKGFASVEAEPVENFPNMHVPITTSNDAEKAKDGLFDTPISPSWDTGTSVFQFRPKYPTTLHKDLVDHHGKDTNDDLRTSFTDIDDEAAEPDSIERSRNSSVVKHIFTPLHSRNVSKQETQGEEESDETNREDRQSLLSQILGTRAVAASDHSPLMSSLAPYSGREARSATQNDEDTIQIMLNETPELKNLSERWHDDRMQSSPGRGPQTPSKSIGTTTPFSETPTRSGGGQDGSSTMGSDSYSMIYRVLEQYHESGAISPEMVSEFHQHILETDPDLSNLDDAESLHIAKVALEGLIREHSRGNILGTDVGATTEHKDISASPLRDYLQTRSRISQASLDQRPHNSISTTTTAHMLTEKVEAPQDETAPQVDFRFTPMNNFLHQTFGDKTQVAASQETDKVNENVSSSQDAVRALPVHFAQKGPLIPATRAELPQQRSAYRSFREDNHMQLPEIQNTGGGLGLAIGFGQDHALSSSREPTSFSSSFSEASRFGTSLYGTRSRPEQSFSSQSTPPSDVAKYNAESSNTTPTRQSRDTIPSSISQNASVDCESIVESNKQLIPNSMTSEDTKRLQQRRYVIKELLDTEHSYNQDMKIVRDIYMTTADEDVLSPEDKRILFVNTKEVVAFSEDFLASLRDAARSVYVRPRDNRFPAKHNSISASSSMQKDQSSNSGFEALDDENDRSTSIGDAFLKHLERMEKVYGDYTKNGDFAGRRLAKLARMENVDVWLTMCQENAQDLTTAWDLDSLLVKPSQRLLKYPMLLEQLIKHTTKDHPDYATLVQAEKSVIEMSRRVDEKKMRLETLELINKKKEKEREKIIDFSKVLGRRKEKFRQQVGVTSAVEDIGYLKVSEKFGGQLFQLSIVRKDFALYTTTTKSFVQQFVRFIEAIEECLAVGATEHQDLERKWRKFAQAIRELSAVAWTEHESAIKRHCVDPLDKVMRLHDEPEKMMAQRKSRLVDYAKYKAMVERGAKLDRKTENQFNEFNVLNDTLKDELPRLYSLSRDMSRACLTNFVELQKRWNKRWHDRIASVLGEHQIPKSMSDIVEVYLSDFAYPEAQVVCLGICNGSLLADTSNFLSPATTIAGSFDERNKRPSLGTSSYTTASLHSEQSPSLATPDFTKGGFNFTPYTEQPSVTSEHRTTISYPNGNSPVQPRRARAISSLSSRERPSSSVVSASPMLPISRTNSTKASSWRNFAPLRTSAANSVVGSRLSDGSTRLHRGSSSPQIPSTMYVGSREPITPLQPPQASNHQSQNQAQLHSSSTSVLTKSSSTPSTITPRTAVTAFSSALPMPESRERSAVGGASEKTSRIVIDPSYTDPEPMIQTLPGQQYKVLFLAASLFEFNIDRQMSRAGLPYLTYIPGEIFDVIGQNGELWLARNQDDGSGTIGWIWERHFAKLDNGERQ